MEYCTTLVTDTAHYTTVQNLRVFRGVKTLYHFARTPTACVFSVERRFATGACTPNGVRIMDAPVVIATAVTGADENGCLSLSKAPR